MSALSRHAEDYLQVRRALGYKLRSEGQLLASFVRYLEQAGASTVTTSAAVRWTRLANGASAAHLACRMRVARAFARYLAALDPSTEVPPPDLFPCSKYRPTPYIYTETETLGLMAAARTLLPPLRAATFETLIGLFASTGLRISEATALDRGDLHWGDASLVVRESKYNKSREVLLHKSTLKALRAYSVTRDRLCPYPLAPSFFVSTRGTRLLQVTVHPAFRALARQAGLGDRPKLHSFRHSFAVNTLRDWLADGGEVASRLPALSTYLGHGKPAATYWYFSAVPELLALAAGRLEDAFGGLV
ncbi:MAG TPA: tyrosine-type recombinase/integrase [Acidimicrobiales bacterium]|nr:tyrosine-type recombinase/integrase [Acidimicrobiales bacterium]